RHLGRAAARPLHRGRRHPGAPVRGAPGARRVVRTGGGAGGGAEHLRGLRARPGRAHRSRGARPATGDGGRADGRTGSAAPVAAVVLPVAGAVAAGVAVAVLVGLVGLIRLVGFVAVVGEPDGDDVPGAVRGQLVRAADRVGGPCVAVGCGRLDQVVRTGRQAVEGAGAGRAGGAAPA